MTNGPRPGEGDPFERNLNLHAAKDLMNARVARIMRLVHAEEAKPSPDSAFLEKLRRSHEAIEDDREAMRGVRPAVVIEMIEKYRGMVDIDPWIHD